MLRQRQRGRGFTLVELLVVIGIIALLISILLPAMSKARVQALVVKCASNQRQLANVFIMYANDNRGFFPRFDLNNGGEANLSDMAGTPTAATPTNPSGDLGFFDYLNQHYKLLKYACMCPADSPDRFDFIFGNWISKTPGASMSAISYAVWVPHLSDNNLVPPIMNPPSTTIPGLQDSLITYLDGTPSHMIHGAIHLGDKTARDQNLNDNPIITDAVYITISLLPGFIPTKPQPNFAYTSQGSFQSDYGGHYYEGKMYGVNECFPDGHVETRSASTLRIRFKSNNAFVLR